MRQVTVAFDINGTLVSKVEGTDEYPVANEEVRSVLIFLSKCKNVLIHVWSGNGKVYAKEMCIKIGVDEYVDSYGSKRDVVEGKYIKQHPVGSFKPDIAFDDLLNTELGVFDIILPWAEFERPEPGQIGYKPPGTAKPTAPPPTSNPVKPPAGNVNG